MPCMETYEIIVVQQVALAPALTSVPTPSRRTFHESLMPWYTSGFT